MDWFDLLAVQGTLESLLLHQTGTLVTTDKLTLTRPYHLESLVYVRVSVLWVLTNDAVYPPLGRRTE